MEKYNYASTNTYIEELMEKVFSPVKAGSNILLYIIPGRGYVTLLKSLMEPEVHRIKIQK